MAKPEWGTKRICLACGARFYDLQRSPIVCPACGAVFDAELAGRARRQRSAVRPGAIDAEIAAPGQVEHAEVGVAAEIDEIESEPQLEEAGEVVEEVAEDEEDVLLEDAADLADDEAMGDVLEEEIGPEEEHH